MVPSNGAVLIGGRHGGRSSGADGIPMDEDILRANILQYNLLVINYSSFFSGLLWAHAGRAPASLVSTRLCKQFSGLWLEVNI